jgi:hypothetical protein
VQAFLFNIDPVVVQQYHQQTENQRQTRSLRLLTTPSGVTLPGGQSPVTTQEADLNFWQNFIGQPGQGYWGGQFGTPNTQSPWYDGSTPTVTWQRHSISPFLGFIPEIQGGGWGGNGWGGNVFW